MLALFHQIVTFDAGGVSGHANHIACFEGVSALAFDKSVRVFVLETTNLLRKYTGVLDVFVSILSGKLLFIWMEPQLNYSAMQAHFTQFVWYRKLFVLFSRYTFMNTLVMLGREEDGDGKGQKGNMNL